MTELPNLLRPQQLADQKSEQRRLENTLSQPHTQDKGAVGRSQDGWNPARLIAPMQHRRAESGGETAQRAFLKNVLEEDW